MLEIFSIFPSAGFVDCFCFLALLILFFAWFWFLVVYSLYTPWGPSFGFNTLVYLSKKIKAGRRPEAREERSPASKSEDEGVEISQAGEKGHPDVERLGKVVGTWSMVETKAKWFFPTQ